MVLKVDGQEAGKVVVARTVPAAFSATETFGAGVDLGSPVSPDYFDRRPFRFEGTSERVDVEVFEATASVKGLKRQAFKHATR